jgi:hypothetical protein
MSVGGGGKASRAVGFAANFITESKDVVDALFGAIPRRERLAAMNAAGAISGGTFMTYGTGKFDAYGNEKMGRKMLRGTAKGMRVQDKVKAIFEYLDQEKKPGEMQKYLQKATKGLVINEIGDRIGAFLGRTTAKANVAAYKKYGFGGNYGAKLRQTH